MSEYFLAIDAFLSLSPFNQGKLTLFCDQLFLRYLPLDSLLKSSAQFNLLSNDFIETRTDAVNENRTFSLELGGITRVDGFELFQHRDVGGHGICQLRCVGGQRGCQFRCVERRRGRCLGRKLGWQRLRCLEEGRGRLRRWV